MSFSGSSASSFYFRGRRRNGLPVLWAHREHGGVSGLKVCGVLAEPPAVWASWVAGRTEQDKCYKSCFSGPVLAGEGACWNTAGLKLQPRT